MSSGSGVCGEEQSRVWYALETGGGAQLVTLNTCGSEVSADFEVFQVVDDPDATLSVASLNPENAGGISATVVHDGDTVAEFPAGTWLAGDPGMELELDGGA